MNHRMFGCGSWKWQRAKLQFLVFGMAKIMMKQWIRGCPIRPLYCRLRTTQITNQPAKETKAENGTHINTQSCVFISRARDGFFMSTRLGVWEWCSSWEYLLISAPFFDLWNEGCLKGIPPSAYLRIIKHYSGITWLQKKYSKNSLRYIIWNNIHQKWYPYSFFLAKRK